MNIDQELQAEARKFITRRYFFQDCGIKLGAIALGALLNRSQARLAPSQSVNPLAVKAPHFAPKAKQVIFLFQAGAPSHLELFDEKPKLRELDGKPVPPDLVKDARYAFINPNSALLGPKFGFRPHGQAGISLGETLPHIGSVADEIVLIRSMVTDAFNHAPGQIFMNTGSQQFGRPTLGSWVTYGLGSECQDLPGYVVLSSNLAQTSGGSSNWGSGFLPSVYQGVRFRSQGDPVLYVSNPRGITPQMQRQTLDTLKRLNQEHLARFGDPEIATRINSFEMAYRLQTSAPELMNLASESKETLERYGAQPGQMSYANNCLLARRLVERGVRFVQLFHEAWDHHAGLTDGIREQCRQTDQSTAALIKDLKERGLLDETLVIWAGEFGRTPMVQGSNDGRDHHPKAFSLWMAGGGLKKGMVLGETDELGFNVVSEKVHVHDLHATILHLLGFDHTRLTYRFQGRDFRLTDVEGEVVRKILA